MKNQWFYKILTAFMIVMLAVAALPVKSAYAAAIIVNTLNDEDTPAGTLCSLREAIIAANFDLPYNDCTAGFGSDTITLASGSTYTLTLVGFGQGDLDVMSNITIQASGVGVAAIIDPGAGFNDRVFDVSALGNLTLNTIRITSASTGNDGGALRNGGGTVSISNSTFDTNSATGGGNDGGAIYQTSGTMTIANSTFTSNSATGDRGGAIFINGGTLSVLDSTFTSNQADTGGAIYSGGTSLTVTSTTFTSNSTANNAGGGGAIFTSVGTATISLSTFTTNTSVNRRGGALRLNTSGGTSSITNSTFYGNTTTSSGGGLSNESGTVAILNSTFSGNTAGAGGAIHREGGTVNVSNSIVANSTGTNCSVNGGTINNTATNLNFGGTVAGNACAAFTTPAANPLVAGAPANNGGTTFTIALSSGSTAIDAGTPAVCSGAPVSNASQNGLARPLDGNGDTVLTCDIGSYEAPTALIVTTTTITADTPEPSLVGEAVAVTVTVSGGTTPTGTVDITGADTNCSITLSGGTGSCDVTFTSVGSKTLTATYVPDATHAASSGTEPHTVNQATSSVTVTCPASQVYTGSAITPCTASYSTSDGLSGSLTPTYSNNTNVGTATANASYVGDANHAGSTNSATFAISQATSSVTVTCPASQGYTGSAITPCTASYSTSDGLSGPLTPTYSNNTNVGTATADASYVGDANHAGSSNSATFAINQATSSVTVTCPASQAYTGSAITPCTASYSTSDGLSGPLTPTYSNNTNVGTATADATYVGDANHAGSSNSATFAISQATSSVTVTCPASQVYTGSAITPCTASYSTSDGLSGSLTPTYSNNTNVGTATADATYVGDANHAGSSNSATFAISQATSSVTVTCPASQVYTGSAITPCTASYSTSDGLNSPLTPTYSNNTNVGTATADASYVGDANHAGSTNSATFAISQATSSVTVTCPAAAQPYTGSAQTPCTASFSTSDGLSGPLTPTYSNNTNVGTATADATYAGDANHASSTNSATFAINQATSTVTVTCPVAAQPYTGSAQTPCTASYSTSDGLSGLLTPTYSNNTNAGTATADATYVGDANHAGSTNSATFTISQATSSVTVTCPVGAQPYTGSAQTPCTASYSTSDGLSGPLTPTYSNNTNVGTATADATYAGDANHAGSSNSATFTISQVSSTVTVTCPVTVQPFTGSAQTPCTAEATGVGMSPVDVTASLVYSNNTNLGAATANASWAGDANHTGNTGAGGFTIGQATSTVTVTCPASVTYTGSALTPCTAEATGAGMSPVDVTASLVYSNNTNVGTATADASWAGDVNHTGSTGKNTFAITQDTQTITVTTSVPFTASNGTSFTVAATATSGLTVSITASGVCTIVDNGNGTADITMTSGTGTCSVFYDQAGDANYSAALQVQQDATATEGPSFTSANNTSFDFGFPGSFTVTAVGNPSAMTITLSGPIPAGVTLTNTGTGTETLSSTAATPAGVYNLILTANNGVLPNGTQNFTLTVRNGPIVTPNGVNSTPDTGDGSVGENESIIDTLNITNLTVQFSQDVNDPTGDTDVKDVTNPANYMLVRSTSTTFATIDCKGGVVAPDIAISVDSVMYSDGTPSGAGPFVATLSVNGGLPLNVVGFYRLYVCGTTSIVDAVNTNLILAGNGTTPGTDFQRNFRIATTVVTGGGGGGGGNASASSTLVTSSFLIPVTGFAPNQITTLPAQPTDKAYTSLGQMTIEIPSLGIKFPIIGASITNKTWDLTWLKDNVAYLEGSAYPTMAGNTVLTAHVQDANKNLGPFSDIKGMQVGQNIYIHVNGQTYVYQVQENRKISSNSITSMFKHEEDSWITLVTCEDFNAKTGLYSSRRMVRAVLISVIPLIK